MLAGVVPEGGRQADASRRDRLSRTGTAAQAADSSAPAAFRPVAGRADYSAISCAAGTAGGPAAVDPVRDRGHRGERHHDRPRRRRRSGRRCRPRSRSGPGSSRRWSPSRPRARRRWRSRSCRSSASIRDAPAITVATVRTTGTKRASTMVIFPYLAKNASDFSMYSCLRSFAFGRLNTGGRSCSRSRTRPCCRRTRPGQQADEQPEVDVQGAGRDEQAGDEQQRVAGQEEAEQDAALAEDDQEDAEHRPRAHGRDQVRRVEPARQEGEVGGRHGSPGYGLAGRIPV